MILGINKCKSRLFVQKIYLLFSLLEAHSDAWKIQRKRSPSGNSRTASLQMSNIAMERLKKQLFDVHVIFAFH